MKTFLIIALSFATIVHHVCAQGLNDTQTCYQEFKDADFTTNPDIGLTIDEVLTKYGYPVTRYDVVTQDGYKLGIYRIPYSALSPLDPLTPKKAVYLNHGFFSNGYSFLIQYKDNNLAMKLADAGFDVWIGNCRGNSYSQGHTSLNNNLPPYWNFSFHEMGIYDVPAVINKILNVTGQPKIYYVGHSMGCTAFAVAMSECPELNDKIATAYLLAPAIFIGNNPSSPLTYLAPLGYYAQPVLSLLGGRVSSVQDFETLTGVPVGTFCSTTAANCGACGNLYFAIAGYDPTQTNYTNLGVALNAFPDTISTKTLSHFAQSFQSQQFRKFDYGLGNFATYGSMTPPAYNLSALTAKSVIYWGQNDELVTPKNVNKTKAALPASALKDVIRVDWDQWNHFDFAAGINATQLIYQDMVDSMVNELYE